MLSLFKWVHCFQYWLLSNSVKKLKWIFTMICKVEFFKQWIYLFLDYLLRLLGWRLSYTLYPKSKCRLKGLKLRNVLLSLSFWAFSWCYLLTTERSRSIPKCTLLLTKTKTWGIASVKSLKTKVSSWELWIILYELSATIL